MEENNEEVEKDLKDKVNEQVERYIENILIQGIQPDNIEMLYKLVDIHKDLANEKYWGKKEEVYDMRYSYGRESYGEDYGRESYGTEYGRGRARDSQGRFMGYGRYRGEDMLNEMNEHYRRYQEGKEMYGNEGMSMKALEYMLKLDKEFITMLMQDAKTPEEREMIMRHVRELGEM